MNLAKLFGNTAFEKVICLDTGADKDEALLPYKDTKCWWVEDKPENAVAGHNLGLKAILVEHGHNMYHFHQDIPIAKNWKEIYNIIVS
jgi:FMN phosphatase YigB (HAD superfamily)